MVFRLMMPYLGLETQTLKDGLVHGETSLLGQGATQGPPILGPTLDRHLLAPTLAQQHLLILDQMHQEPTLGNQVGLGPTRLLDHHMLLEPTLLPAPMAFLPDH